MLKKEIAEIIDLERSYRMKRHYKDDECCVCDREAKFRRPKVGLFCTKHKKEYQEFHKKAE